MHPLPGLHARARLTTAWRISGNLALSVGDMRSGTLRCRISASMSRLQIPTFRTHGIAGRAGGGPARTYPAKTGSSGPHTLAAPGRARETGETSPRDHTRYASGRRNHREPEPQAEVVVAVLVP
jgi:hypothetical protein